MIKHVRVTSESNCVSWDAKLRSMGGRLRKYIAGRPCRVKLLKGPDFASGKRIVCTYEVRFLSQAEIEAMNAMMAADGGA